MFDVQHLVWKVSDCGTALHTCAYQSRGRRFKSHLVQGFFLLLSSIFYEQCLLIMSVKDDHRHES